VRLRVAGHHSEDPGGGGVLGVLQVAGDEHARTGGQQRREEDHDPAARQHAQVVAYARDADRWLHA
jgi:hypothetical protein